jgi:hypothetical protein
VGGLAGRDPRKRRRCETVVFEQRNLEGEDGFGLRSSPATLRQQARASCDAVSASTKA